MKKLPIVYLKKGRVKPIWLGHPWVFAEAVESVDGNPEEGDLVEVIDPQGNRLGKGYFNSRSAIPVRILTRDPDLPVDGAFFNAKILQASAMRKDILGLPSEHTTGYRLVNSEGDGLPGLVVDVFGDTAAVQFTTLGMRVWQEQVFAALDEILNPAAVVEVAGFGPSVAIEGLIAEPKIVRGDSDLVATQFLEGGTRFGISLPGGQKTGFYLDQRENRTMVASLCNGKRVLDGFCFVGGFGIRAAAAGASMVTGVDSSAPALASAKANAELNGFQDKTEWVQADVLRFLRDHADEGTRWDVVVLDPPKFAHKRGDVNRAIPTYRRLNAAGIAVVERGGVMVTNSCSGSISEDDLLRVIAEAAREVGRSVQILQVNGAAPDHPVLLPCFEGRYLKSILCRIL